MLPNLIIGMGNTGSQIVKLASLSNKLDDCLLYAIDSVTSTVTMDNVSRINTISLISDDKTGSGRSRERGAAMFEFHDKNGTFDQLYAIAEKVKTPILVITSAAGGTGSGSTPELCRRFIERDIPVIPIIVTPSLKEPMAYHMNTNDLMVDLGSAGVSTYCVFRNDYGTADYTEINTEVVRSIEIILGKMYDPTDKDSIDESDLDVILSTPGRFIAVGASAQTPSQLKRVITEHVLNGHQPFSPADVNSGNTLMTAYSLSSPFASGDFEEVFSVINARIPDGFDNYRNICDRDGSCQGSIIVAGLPRPELKEISADFKVASGIGEGISPSASKRPSFMKKKGTLRSVVKPEQTPTVNDAEDGEKKNDILKSFNLN